MTLGKRQLNNVLDIMEESLREEVRSSFESRMRLSKSRLTEMIMFEDAEGPFVSGVFKDDVAAEVDLEVSDLLQKFLEDIDKIMYKKMSAMLQTYGGDKVSASVLRDDMKDFDHDAIADAQQELIAKATLAIDAYVVTIADYCNHAKLIRQEEE